LGSTETVVTRPEFLSVARAREDQACIVTVTCIVAFATIPVIVGKSPPGAYAEIGTCIPVSIHPIEGIGALDILTEACFYFRWGITAGRDAEAVLTLPISRLILIWGVTET